MTSTMISVCILAKDEERFIARTINSVKDFVGEVVVLDDQSSDNTVSIATNLGARIVGEPELSVRNIGFANMLNWLIQQAKGDWVLILDCDELLSSPHLLESLTRHPDVDAWRLPRRKWLDFSCGIRDEYEAYPDWQPKFFRRPTSDLYVGEMHIRFLGKNLCSAYKGPHIEHLQKECRTEAKLLHRHQLYSELSTIQGVEIEGGKSKRLAV
jgi:glycosyltransferase involved in cell wall biosynthesis